MTTAAPKASVDEPAKAATMREPRSEPKDLATAPHTLARHNMREARTKTGLLPKYTAVGTQKKFLHAVSRIIPPEEGYVPTPRPSARRAHVNSPEVVVTGF